ncbi:MAG: hypothetical protein ABI622_05650 [Chloroflexota bacterium]
MFKSLIRTFKGPSSDPRMAYISRPLATGLLDEQVLEALTLALEVNPDPAYLVETLQPALLQVTGRHFEVMDRSVRDVTGSFVRTAVMIRDGDVGHWPGYDTMAYPLLARDARLAETRDALAAAEGEQPPAPKPGWEPPERLPGRSYR